MILPQTHFGDMFDWILSHVFPKIITNLTLLSLMLDL